MMLRDVREDTRASNFEAFGISSLARSVFACVDAEEEDELKRMLADATAKNRNKVLHYEHPIAFVNADDQDDVEQVARRAVAPK